MPKFFGKKPFQQEIFTRQVGEIHNLLHALELRDAFSENENRPPMDMYETAGEIVVEFDLPGFCLEDISLVMRGASLVLDAQRAREQLEDDSRFVCLERSSGRFRHVVNIHCSIDSGAIRAEYSKGVLRVICPKIGERCVPISER